MRTQTPSTEAITAALPAEHQGVASALNDVTREFGTALGVAAADGAGTHAQTLIRAAHESFVVGWRQAMWAGVGVMTVLFGYVLARAPRRTRSGRS